jgi:glycosyltransferase involved in cell wall biosynthesis
VVTPSYASRRQLDSLLFSPRSVSVIPNGVTFDDTLPGTAQASKSVLFIGNFRYYKGIDILLASWKRAKTSNSRSEWRLTIITNESQFEVERIRIRFGLDENVSFFSRINDAEATHLRNQAAVVVLPSRHEGFGIPLLEAVAAGRHVLHSNIEAFTELTSHFNLKQFTSFEAGSTDALVDALNHVLEHEDSLLNTKDRDYIFNNREVLTERFSWDVSVLGLNEILTSET